MPFAYRLCSMNRFCSIVNYKKNLHILRVDAFGIVCIANTVHVFTRLMHRNTAIIINSIESIKPILE